MELFGQKFSAAELMAFGVGAQWLLSAVAHAMPEPDAASGKGYRFTYNFIQAIAANLSKIRPGSSLPPPPSDPPKVVPIDRAA